MLAEKITMGEYAGHEQSNVPLEHYQEKNRVKTVAADEVVKEIEMHD